MGGDHEAADDLVVLAHRRGERRADPVGRERLQPVLVSGVILDHDELPGRRRLTARAEPDGAAVHPLRQVGTDPGRGEEDQLLGVVGVQQPQADGLVAEQVHGAGDDRVEDLRELVAADDRALDVGQSLEQSLALGQRLEQVLVLARLLVAQLTQRALGLDDAKQAHGERQRPRHAAGEVALLRGEDGLVVPGEHERDQTLVVDRGRKRLALADAGDPKAVRLAATDALDLLRGHRLASEPGRREHAGRADDGACLSFKHLAGAFDGVADRRQLIVGGRDRREELRQLLGSPACRHSASHCLRIGREFRFL